MKGRGTIISSASIQSYNNLTNEELVFMIQDDLDNQELWNTLWTKTKDTIYYVYHKKVHRYYKEQMSEDLLAILNMGWFRAVTTYDKEKATGPFHAYAPYIIEQQYHQFLRKVKPEKDGLPARIGKSVRSEYLNDIKLPCSFSDCSNTVDFCITNILEDTKSTDPFKQIELADYLKQKLERLKIALPNSYDYIIETVYNNKTQIEVAKERNISKHTVSRAIKQGYEWLRADDEVDKQEEQNLRDYYDNKK